MQCALKLCPPAAAKEQPASPKPGSIQAAVVDCMEEVRLALLEAANQRSLYRPLVLRTTSRAVAVLLAVSQGQRLLVKAAGGCPGLHSLSCIGWGACPEVELHIIFGRVLLTAAGGCGLLVKASGGSGWGPCCSAAVWRLCRGTSN